MALSRLEVCFRVLTQSLIDKLELAVMHSNVIYSIFNLYLYVINNNEHIDG